MIASVRVFRYLSAHSRNSKNQKSMISTSTPDHLTVPLHPSQTAKLAAIAERDGVSTVNAAAKLLREQLEKELATVSTIAAAAKKKRGCK